MRRIAFREPGDWEREARQVAEHLRAGGLIAYPTETVYGFGSALRPAALAALARLKQREPGRPFLVLIRERKGAGGLEWTPAAERLADAFWPGPLTLALRTDPGAYPEEVIANGAVAVRATPHAGVRALLGALGGPLTSTSANVRGRAPATSADDVVAALAALGGSPDLWLLDGGILPPSAPSSIVDCSGERPRVIREGAVPLARLRAVVKEIDV